MNKAVKSLVLAIIIIVIVNILTRISDAMSANPSLYTNGYTLSYTTLIILSGAIIESFSILYLCTICFILRCLLIFSNPWNTARGELLSVS
jgi:hypothetical protein